MPSPLRFLFVEDLATDFELAEWHLRSEGLEFTSLRVDTQAAYLQALKEFQPDIIISDYSMPGFDGMQALRLIQEAKIDIPFIILTGSMNEDIAVECLKAGAQNYVIKENIHRLPMAVLDALKQHQILLAKQRAEEQLLKSEAKFRALFQNNHTVMLLIDPADGKIVDVNPAACSFYGWSKEEFETKHIAEINTLSPEEVNGEMQKALQEQRDYFQFEHRLKNGSIRDVEVFSGPIEHQGKVLLYSIVHDVTERKQAQNALRESESRYRSLIFHSPDAIIVEHNDRIQLVNQACIRLLGAKSENEILGKSAVEFTHPDYHEVVHAQRRQLKDFNQPIPLIEQKIVRLDGTVVDVDVLAAPFPFQGSTYIHIIMRDITKRKRAELALKHKSFLQERMAALGRDLAATLNLLTIYQTAERYIKELVDCQHFQVALLDPDHRTLRYDYSPARQAPDGSQVESFPDPIPLDSCSGCMQAIEEKIPVIVHNGTEDAAAASGSAAPFEPGGSTIHIPIIVSDEVIGIMDLQSSLPQAYTPADGEWLSVIANQVGLAIQNARQYAQIQSRVSELQILHNIDQAITTSIEPGLMFQKILEQIATLPNADAAAILLFNPEDKYLYFRAGFGFLSPEIEQVRLKLGDFIAGRVALERQPILLVNPNEEIKHLFHTQFWEREGFTLYIGQPLLIHGELKGVLEVFSRKLLVLEPDKLSFLASLAHQVAIAIHERELVARLEIANAELLQAYDATIAGWSQAMDLRDKETEGHTERVVELTIKIARALGLNEEKLMHIRRGALLHDIGKLGVPDHILHKAGPLTEEEWDIMKKHPVFAYEMLSSIDYLRPALAIPYCHHEKWDGTGYPQGLKGQKIPLEARIFALADVYDALTSDRPYRSAWSRQKALEYIEEQSGKHFDPKIVSAFLALLKSSGF